MNAFPPRIAATEINPRAKFCVKSAYRSANRCHTYPGWCKLYALFVCLLLIMHILFSFRIVAFRVAP